MPRFEDLTQLHSRRTFLQGMALAPLLFRAASLHGLRARLEPAKILADPASVPGITDFRLRPNYPAKSPLDDVLRLVAPGSDEYVTEKYAFEIEAILNEWSRAIKAPDESSSAHVSVLAKFLDPAIEATPLLPVNEIKLRSANGIDIVRRRFASDTDAGRDKFLRQVADWLGQISSVETAEFQITSIDQTGQTPLAVNLDIRYDIVGVRKDSGREERIGYWRTDWLRTESGQWRARRWQAANETLAVARGPVYLDITKHALGEIDSYNRQMLRGVDYWRTVLDGACGIDVYGNNGIAAGDFDNDGLDDLYICQPAGLPNRLYRNRGDGTFEDVTEKAGVEVLDSTACALFADFQNKGLQDLLVVCGSEPLLFLNQGNGTFIVKRDAFKFAHTPQGTFAHAAIADYDRDGRLDIYFCVYSYYLGLDQYHYPVPYFDARNGPPNFLLHNEGNGVFVDRTEAAGLNVDNDRYSFACAWGSCNSNGMPDLYVANDFGRSNLYRNNGDGTFTAVSSEAHVEDVGAGMSASWSDVENGGKQDIYVANMWSAAGQRVSVQKPFQENAPEDTRALYRRHARGNSLYRNQGNGKFQNMAEQAGVQMGRWSWCSDFLDFDHDGYPDLYIANGYISGPDRNDLGSFFWRQVVAKSPDDATPKPAYERGWNALNELVRSDSSWSGYERNVMYANNRDGTFSEISGAIGLDFPEDSRSFALADIDHDGRLEIILKNRNAPQLRILRNSMIGLGNSISFRLRGRQSNRDAIGAAIRIESGVLRQTKYLQAGSGFLAQHTKEIFFGVGGTDKVLRATVLWPSGLSQEFADLPAGHRIEIEEGSATYVAKPFAVSPHYEKLGPMAAANSLPTVLGTWLIEPLEAPEFSLPDLSGAARDLQSYRGGFVLLNFWATAAPTSADQLRLLHQYRAAALSSPMSVLAINVDDPNDLRTAQSFAARERFSFPILFANADTIGIYNLIYRYLFDRRRNLPVPASFLLDREGMIIKVYQGVVEPKQLLEDVQSAPGTLSERMTKALPLGGALFQDAFQRNDFTYGIAMFQHGYLDQAAASFAQVIAEKPDDAEAYYNLGTLNLRRNDLVQARHYLEETVKLRPNYPEAWNNLGMIAGQDGHIAEAIQNFQQSLLLRPDFAIALVNLGNIYRRQKNFVKAGELLNHAIKLEPEDPEANYSLGMFYAQQDDQQEASDYLQRAVSLRPNYPEALNNLGVLLARERNYEQAEEQFKACIRVAPNFDQSYLNLARLYVSESDKEKARQVLQELLRLQPQNPGALHVLETLQ